MLNNEVKIFLENLDRKQKALASYNGEHDFAKEIKNILAKWTLTMFRLGVRAVKVILRIAKCCAKPTIEQKVIGNIPENY